MGGSTSELTGPDLATGIDIDQLRDGQPLLGHAQGEAVVLVKRGDACHAVGATCTHYSGPLAEGLVVGDTIHCPWHHARFDLTTGAPLGGPGINPLPCYQVAREGKLVRITGKSGRCARPRLASPRGAPASVVIVGAGPAGAVVADTLRGRRLRWADHVAGRRRRARRSAQPLEGLPGRDRARGMAAPARRGRLARQEHRSACRRAPRRSIWQASGSCSTGAARARLWRPGAGHRRGTDAAADPGRGSAPRARAAHPG